MKILAPGKAVVAGEYSVLEGYPALAMAVGAWAESSPLPLVGRGQGEGGKIDTSQFSIGKQKLGLGSSSAVAVIRAATLTLPSPAGGRGIFEAALEMHQKQHGGSGIDIAACFFGGFIEYQNGRATQLPTPSWANDLQLVFLGRSQKTSEFLARVQEYKKSHPSQYHEIIQRLAAVVAQIKAGDLVAGFDAHASALDDLGKATDLAIVDDSFRTLASCAKEFGGAAKPSGAGGGDIALCFVPKQNQTSFGDKIKSLGFVPLGFQLFVDGVKLVHGNHQETIARPHS